MKILTHSNRNAWMPLDNPPLTMRLSAQIVKGVIMQTLVKSQIVEKIVQQMKEQKLTKQKFAQLLNTSRSQLDRILDPKDEDITISSLMKAFYVLKTNQTTRTFYYTSDDTCILAWKPINEEIFNDVIESSETIFTHISNQPEYTIKIEKNTIKNYIKAHIEKGRRVCIIQLWGDRIIQVLFE